jgi:hypothetical protein
MFSAAERESAFDTGSICARYCPAVSARDISLSLARFCTHGLLVNSALFLIDWKL